MPWKLIRLEHGPTASFPNGSAVRSYLLRLPLKPDGYIDAAVHGLDGRRSTMRRHWASEHDLSGYVIKNGLAWMLVPSLSTNQDKAVATFEDCALLPGAMVQVTDNANKRIPFTVADVRDD